MISTQESCRLIDRRWVLRGIRRLCQEDLTMTNDDRSHIEELAHLYVDGAFDRRELLRRVARVTGSIAAATVALQSVGLADAKDEIRCICPEDVRVPEDAHDLDVMQVEFPGEAGTIFAHQA